MVGYKEFQKIIVEFIFCFFDYGDKIGCYQEKLVYGSYVYYLWVDGDNYFCCCIQSIYGEEVKLRRVINNYNVVFVFDLINGVCNMFEK